MRLQVTFGRWRLNGEAPWELVAIKLTRFSGGHDLTLWLREQNAFIECMNAPHVLRLLASAAYDDGMAGIGILVTAQAIGAPPLYIEHSPCSALAARPALCTFCAL